MQPPSAHSHAEPSPIRGGPFYRAQEATRLFIRPNNWNRGRRIAVAIAVVWLPVVLITAVCNRPGLPSLLRDCRVYSRVFLAIPALLLGQALMEPRVRMVLKHLNNAHLLDYRVSGRRWRLFAFFATTTFSALIGAACRSTRVTSFTVLPADFRTSSQSVLQNNPSALTIPYEHWTGDLDGMIKRRQIRALVVYSRSAFFYDQGQPEGISFEALQEFQRTLNRELRTAAIPLTITFLPVGVGDLEQDLENGLGDLIAVPVAITPERQQKVAFSTPLTSHVTQIIVTGPTSPGLTSLNDLSGKEVFVNPVTVYTASLQNLNKAFESKGKKPVIIKPADKELSDEDLLEMVNAGLIPATVTINTRAVFWAKVFDHLHPCSGCVLSKEEQVAWVMRKDSPQLKQKVDEFVRTHREGTSFGNTLLRRYLRNTKWVENATSDEEMKKFRSYVAFFKKYAAQYDFDYLMLVALSYQESRLNQDTRNPSGAVGIMQVMPKDAAASPIDIPNVETAEPNIHAGTKMLRMIEDTYFEDPKLDALNKTLLTFASYNAGPTRIAELRSKAASEGLNPDKWFGNVELVVAKEVGQQTVRYVSNIYKYYVSYKLALKLAQEQEEATHSR
jgi:membrane-bound lytic murein transglycosylase MltF